MIATLLLPLLAQSASMQEGPPVPEWNCADPQVQMEMNWCAGQEYEAADAALNTQWAATAAVMKKRDAEWAELDSSDSVRVFSRAYSKASAAGCAIATRIAGWTAMPRAWAASSRCWSPPARRA